MTDDDRPIGSVLTRREALAFLGAGGLTALHVGRSVAQTAGTPTCVARPALTEGPYFVDEKLNRSDIRSDPRTGPCPNGTIRAAGLDTEDLGPIRFVPLIADPARR